MSYPSFHECGLSKSNQALNLHVIVLNDVLLNRVSWTFPVVVLDIRDKGITSASASHVQGPGAAGEQAWPPFHVTGK